MIRLLVKYILTAALRDRLFVGFLLLVGVGISLSIFLGSSAITEKDQFSLIFAAGGLRVGGLVTLVLFTVFYVRRSFEARDVEYLLSRPLTRLQFLIAHALAFSILATVLAFFVTAAIALMPSQASFSGVLLWGLSVWIEFIIMATISLFFALVLSSAVTASLMGLAFYVLARLMGGILGIIATGSTGGIATLMLQKIMLLISIFIPRLDVMGQSSWLLYGTQGVVDWLFLVLQGAVFCGLVFSASYFDLKRKQF